jgi:PAS domain S-box-containing protein
MEEFRQIVQSGEDWLADRILHYASAHNYTQYTSTLKEAWIAAVQGISESLILAAREGGSIPPLDADDDYTKDPIAGFGIIEAQRHRERGVTIGMFLSVLKYWRKAYLDLVASADPAPDRLVLYRSFVETFFDRLELGICTEWCQLGEHDHVRDLENTNRFLSNEKNKYLTLFDSIPLPAFLLDDELRIDNVNAAAAKFLGRRASPGSEYYCRLRDRRLEHTELKEEDWEQRCIQGVTVYLVLPWLADRLEVFVHRAEEESSFAYTLPGNVVPRHLWVRFARLHDYSGKFSGTVVTLEDVTVEEEAKQIVQQERDHLERIVTERTSDLEKVVEQLVQEARERRWTQEALRKSEEHYRALVEHAAEGIWAFDAKGTTTFVNRQMSEMLGYEADDMLGRSLPDFVDGESREVIQETWEHRNRRLQSQRDVMFKRRDGAPLWALLNMVSLLDDQGNAAATFVMVTDITQRKLAERQMAESLTEKEVLLREIHHRVKNSLSVITSLLSLQSMYWKDAGAAEALRELENRVHAMALAHQRLYESGSLARLDVPDFLERLLNDIFNSYANVGAPVRLDQRFHQVAFDLDTVIPLGFLLTELVSNCLKHAFTDREEGHVRVALHALSAHEFELVVADDGIGLPPGFDWKNPGSIGYELVDTFVEQLQGSMDVRVDAGTEVRIRFREAGHSPGTGS